MRARVFLNAEVRRIFRRVLEPNDRLECQCPRPGMCRELDQRQAIAEYVVDPPDLGRARRDLTWESQQALIKTVPRPEHQLMRAWPHGLLVLVRRRMMDGENRHGGPLNPKHSRTIKYPLPAARERRRRRFFIFSPASRPLSRAG